MKSKPKPRVVYLKNGQIAGMLGRRRAITFVTVKQAADWLFDQQHPRRTDGHIIHPLTGEKAPDGQVWVVNKMTREYVLESDQIPYTLSVASETYWCS